MMADKITLDEKDVYSISTEGGELTLDGHKQSIQIEKISKSRFIILRNHQRYSVEVQETEGSQMKLKVNGKETIGNFLNPIGQLLESMGISNTNIDRVNELKAPMPGTILELTCKPGDLISKGDPLLILEAMKMENVIKSPGEGEIDTILVSKGQNVDKNQALIRFK